MNGPPKLIRVQRLDSIALDSKYFTDEGYFIDTPIVTSVGIFEYANADGTIRRELRLPKNVFDKDSLASYEGKPVIVTHNAGRVDKDNVDREIVGTMLGAGYKDGNDVRVKVIIHDIDKVKRSGLRELSLGYDLELDETPGTWKGQPYDAIQTNIVVNHLALVKDARAGDHARLNLDSKNQKGATSVKKNAAKISASLQKVLEVCKKQGITRLDEAEIVLMQEIAKLEDGDLGADAGEPNPNDGQGTKTSSGPEAKIELIKEKFDSLTKDTSTSPSREDYMSDVGDLLAAVEYLKARYDSEIAIKDNMLGGDVATAGDKPSLMNADSVSRIVQEQLKLARIGDRLNLDGLEAMSPLEAKKAIIQKINPSMRLDGKGDVYINTAFDIAVEQLETAKDTNYQRRQAAGRADGYGTPPVGGSGAAEARKKMIEKQLEEDDE